MIKNDLSYEKEDNFIEIYVFSYSSFFCNIVYSQNNDEHSVNIKKISFGFELTPQTKYLSHSIPLDNGFVIQPDAWISYGNLTLEIWGNYSINDKSSYDASPNHEFNIFLYYNFLFDEKFTITPKLNYYKYLYEEYTPPYN